MTGVRTRMTSDADVYHRTWLHIRETALKAYFGLDGETSLLDPSTRRPQVTPRVEAHLDLFNLHWHVIPCAAAVPFDEVVLRASVPTGASPVRGTSTSRSQRS